MLPCLPRSRWHLRGLAATPHSNEAGAPQPLLHQPSFMHCVTAAPKTTSVRFFARKRPNVNSFSVLFYTASHTPDFFCSPHTPPNNHKQLWHVDNLWWWGLGLSLDALTGCWLMISEPAVVGTQNRKIVQKSFQISVMKTMKFIHIISLSKLVKLFFYWVTLASRLFWYSRPESR